MTKEELLKEIMKLPKAETDNPISTMNSINVDDLINAVDRLKKIPDYNDLLKENQELKKQYEKVLNDYCRLDAYNRTQQKEFISYLESEIDRLEKTEFYIDSIQKAAIETHKHNLSKYKEIIGGKE